MFPPGGRLYAAVALAALLILPAPWLAGLAPTGSALGHSGGASAAATVPSRAATNLSSMPPSESASGSGLFPGAARALDRAIAQRVPSEDLFLPHALAASAVGDAPALAGGHTVPDYSSSPAPMGVAEYGLRNASNGSVVPFRLNTTSILGEIQMGAGGIEPLYLFGGDPDGFSVQLNAVATNVTVMGQPGYEFWAQNTATYSPYRHLLVLTTNVWNFSSPASILPPNSIVAHGRNGTIVPFSMYYATRTIANVVGPFGLTFYLNSSVNASRNEIDFSVVVSSGSGVVSYPYDYVVFNSTGNGTVGTSVPSNFTADGFSDGPSGLPNDFELVLGGPGDGSQTELVGANATLALGVWNATAAAYQSVPSALAYGSDSGETVSGASLAWTTGAAGVDGGGPYAVLTNGPSILSGLWNASTPAGVGALDVSVTPSNAWVFVTRTTAPRSGNFTVNESEWAPTIGNGGNLSVSPGRYEVSLSVADHDPVLFNVTVNSSATTAISAALPLDIARGVYVPIYVWNDSQLDAVSSGGAGFPADPYLLDTGSPAPFASEFGTLNDYTYPVFAGVFLDGTQKSVEIENATSLATRTPYSSPTTCPPTLACLPSTNALPYDFYRVENVSVVDARNISGWYGTGHGLFATQVPSLAPYAMVFWNASNNLVAGNTFDLAATGGIYLAGGTDNTIFGNTFLQGAAPYASPGALWPSFYGIGIEDAQNGDLSYGNVYDDTAAATPAWTPELNLYTGQYRTWVDYWNITEQPAFDVNYAAGFPNVPLTGSLVHTSFQGGSYWWNYGAPSNPLGLLPYNASGYIAVGGDHYPLVPEFTVQLTENGLPAGTNWSATLHGTTENSTTSTIVFVYQDTVTSASFSVTPVPGYVAEPGNGSLELNLTTPAFVDITFVPSVGTLSGSVTPSNATVTVDGRPVVLGAGGSFSLVVTVGLHAVTASEPAYYPFFTNTSVAFGTNTRLPIVLHRIQPPAGWNGTLEVSVVPATAALWVDGVAEPLSSGGFTGSYAPGLVGVRVSATGFYVYTNNVSVASNTTSSLTVTLDAISPPPPPGGTLVVDVATTGAALLVDGQPASLTGGVYRSSAAAGLHSLAVLAPGFYSYYNNVTVTPGNTTSLTVTLQAIPVPGVAVGSDVSLLAWVIIVLLAGLVGVLLAVAIVRLGRRSTVPPGPKR